MTVPQKIIFNRRLHKEKQEKLTLVIGAKFDFGVVLVADSKVTNSDSPDHEHMSKLKEPYPNSPICFGASGFKATYDQFNRKILQIAAEHMREIDMKNRGIFNQNNLKFPEIEQETEEKTLNKEDIENKKDEKEKEKHRVSLVYNYTMENFLEDSQKLIRKLCSGHDGMIRPHLETLTILHTDDDGARLHHLDSDGSEEEVDFYAIGSGASYVNLFLTKFWNKKMTLEDVLKLAYFCIYYVQDLDFDSGVGVKEGLLPDHFAITDDGKFGYYKGFEGKESDVIVEVRAEVNKFKNIIDNLPFKK